MTVKNIIKWHSPILETVCEPVDFEKDMQCLLDLRDTMDSFKTLALGLSAPQIGYAKRAFAMKLHMKGVLATYVVVNPVLEEMSKELEVMAEGCLSFPWLKSVPVIRPAAISGHCYGIDGKLLNFKLNGMDGRVFQHECEHLMGITIDHHRRAAKAAKAAA